MGAPPIRRQGTRRRLSNQQKSNDWEHAYLPSAAGAVLSAPGQYS